MSFEKWGALSLLETRHNSLSFTASPTRPEGHPLPIRWGEGRAAHCKGSTFTACWRKDQVGWSQSMTRAIFRHKGCRQQSNPHAALSREGANVLLSVT